MKYNNDQVLKLMSLSEEINQINMKVKQLVDDLHGAEGVLGNIKELSTRLQEKVGEFNGNVDTYKPTAPPKEENKSRASYESEGMERERIVPTPQNWRDYAPQSYARGPAPTSRKDAPLPKPDVIDEPKVNNVKVEDKVDTKTEEAVEKLEKKFPPKKESSTRKKSKRAVSTRSKRRSNKLFGNKNNIDKFSGGTDEK
tara:strand:- start:864 stop:1457 length:594 start_codon:yes stop_codon:yes gene_type:complete